MFTDYEAAHGYFYGKKNRFWDMDLANIRLFLKRLGSHENRLNIVQVAGTNGKGSTVSFLSRILMHSGYRVGRFTSPAVFSEAECITVDDRPMTEAEFTDMVNHMYAAMEASEREGRLPTIFELETAMAIEHFYKKRCDVVILEAGLGGEKDATNVSKTNLLSVITSISLDHRKYLGDTIEEIATVKSGIIKKAAAVVMGVNAAAAAQAIIKKAKEQKCRFAMVQREQIEYDKKPSLEGQTFSYRHEQYELGMLGAFQAENAALAIEAARMLKEVYPEQYGKISKEAVRTGLKSARWHGRFEVVSEKNLVIADGAHNPDAALRLRENIELYLKDYNIVSVMGVFADKDYYGIISIMKPYLQRAVTVSAYGDRALGAAELREAILQELGTGQKEHCFVEAAEDYKSALNRAYGLAETCTLSNGKKTAIVVFGSLSYIKYIIGEVQKSEDRK